ncbi:cyanophycinase [Dyadobacter sp. CY356]|uniref:cyanophycinase n=1 Tax=Dyadobacter sp. CY356 TaxID=2906442 RepID=UPI001F423BF5|nr:cyanophycinase [Dyadobacter sp. CY356]MCF0059205.1 cyanophycinase [Dyadobacter sp. CY356]
MKQFVAALFTALTFFPGAVNAQVAKGNLFIIGGGDRPASLMQEMVATSRLKPADYVVLLPMSGANPNTSYYYFNQDLKLVCKNTLANLNFKSSDVNNKKWLDSLENAKLIFISGGDQERFMKIVLNTPIYNAIHKAYQKGATIAGSSAGAAVMSELMITGNELVGDTTLKSTFRKLRDKNLDIKPGLGLLTNAIIDQHFVVRSRYNRLLSAIAKYPDLTCIGIDEATAIIVTGNKVKVVGESQVIVMKRPVELKVTDRGLIKMKDLQFSIFTAGDNFSL